LTAILGGLSLISSAANEVIPAKFVNASGTNLTVEDAGRVRAFQIDPKCRYWKNFAPVPKPDFAGQEAVVVRAKTSVSPALAKELADAKTWAWLEKIRKKRLPGELKAIEKTGWRVAFSDGTQFLYRVTAKSKITIAGRSVPPDAVPVGTKLSLKARTLPNYDTWLVSATDAITTLDAEDEPEADPPPPTPKPTPKPRASAKKVAAPKPLPTSGVAVGRVVLILIGNGIFDLEVDGRTYHITVSPNTRWTIGGERGSMQDLVVDLQVRVAYRRDRFGRIIASKVDIP
jgi:hypothetical protein